MLGGWFAGGQRPSGLDGGEEKDGTERKDDQHWGPAGGRGVRKKKVCLGNDLAVTRRLSVTL